MNKLNKHQPANSTFPIQDNLGGISMAVGLSKLEWAACTIASGWWSNPNMHTETIAHEAIKMANCIFELAEEERQKDVTEAEAEATKIPPSKIIKL
jgi:hypothetical protein